MFVCDDLIVSQQAMRSTPQNRERCILFIYYSCSFSCPGATGFFENSPNTIVLPTQICQHKSRVSLDIVAAGHLGSSISGSDVCEVATHGLMLQLSCAVQPAIRSLCDLSDMLLSRRQRWTVLARQVQQKTGGGRKNSVFLCFLKLCMCVFVGNSHLEAIVILNSLK